MGSGPGAVQSNDTASSHEAQEWRESHVLELRQAPEDEGHSEQSRDENPQEQQHVVVQRELGDVQEVPWAVQTRDGVSRQGAVRQSA